MTERTIDLDAMKSELKASGLDVYTDEYDRLYVGSEGVFGYLKLPHPESPWAGDYWKAVGIIAKHVSPRVDEITIPRELAKRASEALEMVSREPSYWVGPVNQASEDVAAIRARLEATS